MLDTGLVHMNLLAQLMYITDFTTLEPHTHFTQEEQGTWCHSPETVSLHSDMQAKEHHEPIHTQDPDQPHNRPFMQEMTSTALSRTRP